MTRVLRPRCLFIYLLCVSTSCSHDNSDDARLVDPPHLSIPPAYRYPTWSPDGDSIFYMDMGVTHENQHGGWVVDPDSIGLRIVARTGGSGRMVWPSGTGNYSIAPDGSAMCMAISGDLYVGVFVNGVLDTSTFARITNIGGVASPAWSPTGDWVAFDSHFNDERGAQAIWKVMVDGSGLTDLSVHGQGEWIMPAWDFSATKLVHVRYVDDTPMSEIFAMDANGANSVRVTRNNAMDVNPRYSPDAKQICYESRLAGVVTIAIVNADGSHHRTLAFGAMPAWSPNGDEIAFVALTDDRKTTGTIWVAKADGTALFQVTKSRL